MPPPPPLMMMDRRKMFVGFLVFVGLLLLAVGAIVVDNSRQEILDPTPEQIRDQTNARVFWGPAIAHGGMFLLITGLLGAVVFLQDLDVFSRLFLLILSFVSLLLILANSPTIFGLT